VRDPAFAFEFLAPLRGLLERESLVVPLAFVGERAVVVEMQADSRVVEIAQFSVHPLMSFPEAPEALAGGG